MTYHTPAFSWTNWLQSPSQTPNMYSHRNTNPSIYKTKAVSLSALPRIIRSCLQLD